MEGLGVYKLLLELGSLDLPSSTFLDDETAIIRIGSSGKYEQL